MRMTAGREEQRHGVVDVALETGTVGDTEELSVREDTAWVLG